jgi:hypothetical protein
MNLSDFLNYRKSCLSCGGELKLLFHSQKKQKHIYYDDNKLLVQFNLSSFKRGETDHKVGYDIDLLTNDFYIEFYNKSGDFLFENVPTYLMDRYKQLDQNHSPYKFDIICKSCNNYHYASNHFRLNYKTCNLGELTIESESATFHKPIEDGYKAYRLISLYTKNESWLEGYRIPQSYWKFRNGDPVTSNLIKTNLINFSNNQDEMINRLSTLLTFS